MTYIPATPAPVTYAERLTALDANHIHAWELTETGSPSVFADTGNTPAVANLAITNGGGFQFGVPGLLGPCAFNNGTSGSYGTTPDLSTTPPNPGSDFPTGANPFSLEYWYCSAILGATGMNIAIGTHSNGGSYTLGFYPDSANDWATYVQPGTPFTTVNKGPKPQNGQWTYCVVTWGGANYNFYVNGALMTTAAGSSAPGWATQGSANRRFGVFGNADATGNPLRGWLSRVRMSNIARSAAYIETVYKKAMLIT
jgi:hypothetical protein